MRTWICMIAAAATALSLGGPGPVAGATPADRAETTTAKVAGSLTVSVTSAAPSTRVTLRGKVPPKAKRAVKLQTDRSGSWKVLATGKTSKKGKFRFATTLPAAPGGYRYRVLAPRTKIAGASYPKVVTPTRTVTVVAPVTVKAVTTGWRHACALDSRADIWCWGDNTYGALGDGTPISPGEKISTVPVKVVGSGWTSVTAGGAHTCATKADHTAWCWGELQTLGVVVDTDKSVPVQLAGSWTQLSAAFQHTCGVQTNGTGWCWGDNIVGQLGDGTTDDRQTPVQVPGEWRVMTAGGTGNTSINDPAHSCGVKTVGTAWCWGGNGSGQLGNGSLSPATSASPLEVAGGHAFARMSAGEEHTCAVATDATGWCWGSNIDGRLMDGTFTTRSSPTQVPGSWLDISAGFQHSCGVRTSGFGTCYGRNQAGQLGNGTTETVYYPEPVPSQLGGGWTAMTAGWEGSLGLKAGGAWGWGTNQHGELGDGSTSPALTPHRLPKW